MDESLRQITLTYDQYDFEMKKALMSLLVTLSTQPAAIMVRPDHMTLT